MTWRTVTVTDCRLDDANFRGAQLEQVRFETVNCARADFGGARLDTVAFPGSDLAAADFSNARCTDVDLRDARLEGLKGIGSLRGATIGVDQLFGLRRRARRGASGSSVLRRANAGATTRSLHLSDRRRANVVPRWPASRPY